MTIFLNDPNLLRRFRAGDRDALARVYWEYVGTVESLFRRGLATLGDPCRTLSSGRIDLADLLQEVFIKAFATSARLAYDGIRPYGPLLIAIARNTLVDHLRGRGRELAVDTATLEALGETWLAQDEPPEGGADAQTMRVVDQYLDGLAPLERCVYEQRYVLCRSQADAAGAIGLTRQRLRTVEARLRRGLVQTIRRASLYPPEIVVAPHDRPPMATPAVERNER